MPKKKNATISNSMNCPNCHRDIESDAAFCGNCGQALRVNNNLSTLAAVYQKDHKALHTKTLNDPSFGMVGGVGTMAASLPGYALPTAHRHYVKLTIALVLGFLGIPTAFFVPLVGLVFGVAGIVMTTLTESAVGKKIKILSFLVCSVAILCGMGAWVHFVNDDSRTTNHSSQTGLPSNASSTLSNVLTTPCYNLQFPSALTIEHAKGSCELNAFNGMTLDSSSNVYKILGVSTQKLSATNLAVFARSAIQKDIAQNLPNFQIVNQESTSFAGSPAYAVRAENKNANVSVIEAAVLHSTTTPNLFIIVHATQGLTTNLNGLAAGWSWNQ